MSALTATLPASAFPAYAPPAPRRAVIVPPNAGTALAVFGNEIVVKLGSAETGGQLTLALGTVPPGGGPPPHVHRDEDEVFILVSGRNEYWVDGRWTAAEPGTVVYLPRGVPHTFRNAGDGPSRQWMITTPGGFEHFFADCARVFADAAAAGAAPDVTRLTAALARHGLQLVA